MSDEALNWRLEFEHAGNGLREAQDQLRGLQRELSKGQKAFLEFASEGKKVKFEVQGTGDGLDKTGKSAGGLYDLFKRAGDGVKDFRRENSLLIETLKTVGQTIVYAYQQLDKYGERAITAFGEKQGALRAFTTLLGDPGAADVEYRKAQAIGAKTELTQQDSVKAKQVLMTAGFRGDALDRNLAMILDVASMAQPEDRQIAMARLSKAISDIQNIGHLAAGEVKQLDGLVGRQYVYKALNQMGYGKTKAEAVEMQADKKIDASAAITAIQMGVMEQINTKELGSYAIGASGSLAGLISNREEQFDILLKSFDSEALPGTQLYKESLKEQQDAFEVSSKSGANLSIVLQDFADVSMNVKSAWTQFVTGFLSAFAEGYGMTMQNLGKADIKGLVKSAKEFGETLGYRVAPAIATVLHWFEKIGWVLDVVGFAFDTLGGVVSIVVRTIGTLADIYVMMTEGRWKEIGGALENLGSFAVKGGKDAVQFDARGNVTYGADGTWGDDPEPREKDKGDEVAGSKGRKGSGGDRERADFKGDYSSLKAGAFLPFIGLADSPMLDSLRTQMDVAQGGKQLDIRRDEKISAEVKIDRVEILVSGDMDANAVAEKVKDVLISFGRYARTPARGAI